MNAPGHDDSFLDDLEHLARQFEPGSAGFWIDRVHAADLTQSSPQLKLPLPDLFSTKFS
jgi:hypothetical protein